MPTEKPRFSITVDPEMDDAITAYQHKTMAKNKTQAVVSLIEIGLANLAKEKSSAPEGLEEKVDMKESDDLFDDMIRTGLVENNSKLTEADTAFFKSVVAMIETWKANKCG